MADNEPKKIDETVPGGRYIVDGKYVDANGKPIKHTIEQLATEQGVDLAKVEGTGVDGRILKSDVLEAVDVQAAEREESARLQAIAEAEANTTAAALKYAHENGVDLTTITGTGTGGRITLEDVKGANGEA